MPDEGEEPGEAGDGRPHDAGRVALPLVINRGHAQSWINALSINKLVDSMDADHGFYLSLYHCQGVCLSLQC